MFNLTIPIFDINKYMGKWYEIASIELFYEKPCYFSEAVYTKDNNKILVENICYDKNYKKLFSRKGEAYIKNIEEPGKLYLKFTDNKLNYVDAVNAVDPNVLIKYSSNPGESPYFIHYTDYDNISIVGSPTGNYLWILSRHKMIDMLRLKSLSIYIQNLGYDLSKILYNPKRILI